MIKNTAPRNKIWLLAFSGIIAYAGFVAGTSLLQYFLTGSQARTMLELEVDAGLLCFQRIC